MSAIGVLIACRRVAGAAGVITPAPTPATYSIGGTVANLATGLQLTIDQQWGRLAVVVCEWQL